MSETTLERVIRLCVAGKVCNPIDAVEVAREVEILRAELAQLRASVPVLQAQVEEATRQRDECHEFCARAENDRDAARAEADQWRREHEVMCIEAKDARARSRQYADERDAARADVERAQTRIDGLEGVATQLREVRAKLEAALAAARAEAETLRAELARAFKPEDWPCESSDCEHEHTLADVKAHDANHSNPTSGGVWYCGACWSGLAARVSALREAALKARHPSYPDVRDLDAALAAPNEAAAARDERLKREEQRVFYGGLALAFGIADEDLDSVGSSVVEKIRARIARDARAGRDAEWLLVLGVAGVEPTPCTPEQMRGAFAAARAAALEEAARECDAHARLWVGQTTDLLRIQAQRIRALATPTVVLPECDCGAFDEPHLKTCAIRALSAQPAEPTPKERP